MSNSKQTEAQWLAQLLKDKPDSDGQCLQAAAKLLHQEAEILRLRKIEEEWMRLSQDEGKAEKEIGKLREQLTQKEALISELAVALRNATELLTRVAEGKEWGAIEEQIDDARAALAKVKQS